MFSLLFLSCFSLCSSSQFIVLVIFTYSCVQFLFHSSDITTQSNNNTIIPSFIQKCLTELKLGTFPYSPHMFHFSNFSIGK